MRSRVSRLALAFWFFRLVFLTRPVVFADKVVARGGIGKTFIGRRPFRSSFRTQTSRQLRRHRNTYFALGAGGRVTFRVAFRATFTVTFRVTFIDEILILRVFLNDD